MMCGDESTNSPEELKQHMLNHSQQRRQDLKISKKVTDEVDNPKPEKPVEKPVVAPTPIPEKISPPTPIELVYKYIGQCSACRREVATMEIEVEKQLFMIAFCGNCNKKLKDMPVIPVGDQFKGKKK